MYVRPGGEDREHAGEFGAEHAAGNRFMKKTTVKSEAEDRHRLQDIEQRNQHHLGTPALGGEGGIDEGEYDEQTIASRSAWSFAAHNRDWPDRTTPVHLERRQGDRGLLAS